MAAQMVDFILAKGEGAISKVKVFNEADSLVAIANDFKTQPNTYISHISFTVYCGALFNEVWSENLDYTQCYKRDYNRMEVLSQNGNQFRIKYQ